MHIYIDADACPVKEEAARVATRYAVPVTFVSNQGMRPLAGPTVSQVVVSGAFDAADDWIVEQAVAGDVVVTADIPLAARCLEKGCRVVNPNGRPFTADDIGSALAMRDLHAHLRETGDIRGFNPSFSKKDRSQFLQTLDRLLSQTTNK